MKNKKLYSFALLLTLCFSSHGQNSISKGLIIGNSGNGPQTNASIHDFSLDSLSFENSLGTDFIQDVVVDGQYAYIAATDSIFKYDVAGQFQVGAFAFDGTSTGKLYIHGENIFIGNQYGTDSVNLEVFNKNTFASVVSFSEVSLPVSDMVALGDTLYITQNIKHTVNPPWPNFYNDSIGYLAKIDLNTLLYAGDVTFDASQTNNFEKIFSYNGQLHIMGKHDEGTELSKCYTYDPILGTESASTVSVDMDFSYGTQSAQKDSLVYFRTSDGIALYNMSSENLEDTAVVETALISFAIDWTTDKIYTATGDYWSSASGSVFNLSGDSIGSFVPGGGYAPEAFAVIYNSLPVANADYVWTVQGEGTFIENLSNDTDADGNLFAGMQILSGPFNGTAYDVYGYSIGYNSDSDYLGLDSIEYVVLDAFGDTDTSWVYIHITDAIDLDIASFEEQELDASGAYSGSDLWGGFVSGDARFYNNYNSSWGTWKGVSITNHLDTTTSGWMNPYSSYAGDTIHGEQFAVVNGISNEVLVNSLGLENLDGVYLSNNTYAALSMRDGDSFAKKFGGDSGDDEDWFKVQISGFNLAGDLVDTVDFYLADFRFSDNSQDYIVKDWTWVALNMENVASLSFTLSSSDNGDWGMNTPEYFCMDKLTGSHTIIGLEENEVLSMDIYPNPTADVINLNFDNAHDRSIIILDYAGRTVRSAYSSNSNVQMDVQNLPTGIYEVVVSESGKKYTSKLVKH